MVGFRWQGARIVGWNLPIHSREWQPLVTAAASSPRKGSRPPKPSTARALLEPEPLAFGSPADFIVLDVDPMEATPDELHSARALTTFVAGNQIDIDPSLSAWSD